MELTNLENLLDEINYLKEGEKLLQDILVCFDYYELRNILERKSFDKTIGVRLDRHTEFDDSE